MESKPKILIFIVAYNAEKTLEKVLQRIPKQLSEYNLEILIIDDASQDNNFSVGKENNASFNVTTLVNRKNQGYGGNQKLGYQYAIQKGFDVVALLHGDGQYAPEALPELLQPLIRNETDAVFGSRMMEKGRALKGGMPLYKYIGNRILSNYENFMLGTQLTEFHSGYRLYSVKALSKIPFELNTNVFHFDTEIIIQFVRAGLKIKEIPIPTYYGDEICHVNGLRYAWDVVKAVTIAKLQNYNLLYKRNFDVSSENSHYTPKLDFESSHTLCLQEVKENEKVLDIGCGPGHITSILKEKGCKVIGIDKYPPVKDHAFDEFIVKDLDNDILPVGLDDVDIILLMDIIEHLHQPEKFLDNLRETSQKNLKVRIVITTPNVAFWAIRGMLLLGKFNYGKKGILDMTHTRLFTFKSLKNILNAYGFKILKMKGIAPPFPLVVKSKLINHILYSINRVCIFISKGLFAYQIMAVVKPHATIGSILNETFKHSQEKAKIT